MVRELGPVLADVQPTLASLRELSPDLEKLFGDLRPLIKAGRTGLPALSRVLRGIDPTLASTGPFLQQLNPILEYLETQQSTISDFLGVPGSALAVKVPARPGSQTLGHALPQIIVTGSQTLPAMRRTAVNHGNSYDPPGALTLPAFKDPSKFSLPSFDCDHVGTKPPTNTPGCLTAEP